MRVFLPILVIASSLLFAACGTQSDSELSASKNKFRIACDIRVNYTEPGATSPKEMIDTHVSGKKTFADTASAYADKDEIAKVTKATETKCAKNIDKKTPITGACTTVSFSVNSGNIGRFNTYDLGNGINGFYQCQSEIVK